MKKLIAALIAATFSFGSAFAQNAAAPDAQQAAPMAKVEKKAKHHKKAKKAKHKKAKKAAAQ